MEDILRFSLLMVAGFVLFLIILDAWLRRRRLKSAKISPVLLNATGTTHQLKEPMLSDCAFHLPKTEEPFRPEPKLNEEELKNDLLILSIFAKPNNPFVSYDLLQAISNTGMQFGEMNIFHYFSPSVTPAKILFSLASATKPGNFNLDRIGDLSCAGLTLFMKIKDVPEPDIVFKTMLRTAEQLCEDLDGELRAGMRLPWNSESLKQYQTKIAKYT